MTHPLDHDGNGRKGGSLPASQRGKDDLYARLDALGIAYDRRWGRARLEALLPADEAPEAAQGTLTVIAAEAIHDGAGGFLPVGAAFDPVDEGAAAALIAKGLAE